MVRRCSKGRIFRTLVENVERERVEGVGQTMVKKIKGRDDSDTLSTKGKISDISAKVVEEKSTNRHQSNIKGSEFRKGTV